MAQCSSGDQTVNNGLLASSVRLLLEKGIANCIIRFEDSATYGGPREIEVVANPIPSYSVPAAEMAAPATSE